MIKRSLLPGTLCRAKSGFHCQMHGDEQQSISVLTITKGTRFFVIKESKEWRFVRFEDGSDTWLHIHTEQLYNLESLPP